MRLLQPLGLTALLLLLPILALHMLRPRRPRVTVSSLLLWDDSGDQLSAASPWQRLRWSVLLMLQLLIAILLAIAVAVPVVERTAPLAAHTVFVVDASGSMAAIDGTPDRLTLATERVDELVAALPDGGAASVVVASVRPVSLINESEDPAAIRQALRSIDTIAGSADFDTAFALAQSLTSPTRPTGFVLVSDGGVDEQVQRLAPPGTVYEPVGVDDTNRAITDLAVTASPAGLQARVTVTSFGGAEATQTLRIDVDGVTVERREITIPSGTFIEETFELPLGERVAAFLDGEDLLAADNQRYAAAPATGRLGIAVHAEERFFIDQLLSAIPDVVIDPEDDEVDVELFVGTAVPLDIARPFIAIDVPGGVPGITPIGRTDQPVPTFVADDPLLADVDVSRLAIADAQTVEVSSGRTLLGAPGAPLIVAGETDSAVPFFYLTFSLERSNLPVDVAFPMIGSRMIGALTAVEGGELALTVGDAVPFGDGSGTAVNPRGESIHVGSGVLRPVVDVAGFWTLTPSEGEARIVAANPAIAESNVAPAASLGELPPPPPSAQAATAQTVATSLLPWVLIAVAIALGIELMLSRRRRGVGRRQWTVALAVRASLALLLLLAWIDPVFTSQSDEVATVFVVDVSDSMSPAGVAAARAWIDAALADAADAEYGYIEIGRTGAVVAPLRSVAEPPPGDHGVVDATGTDLGRGLRMAQSMLDGSGKQRIVLVSDGRPTTGDLDAEIDRLATIGVPVDVAVIDPASSADAAVSAVTAPAEVEVDESFTVEVEVTSTVAGDAAVTLEAADGTTQQREVFLQPGTTSVAFEVDATATGTQRFTATVEFGGDAREQNDASYTAVSVNGPASVLVVEGIDDNGASIGNALRSRGLVVATVGIAELPPLETLATHQAVLLVDVDAADIDETMTTALHAFVSDLGRGIVVIGGEQSYSLGDYAESPLEALLPVYSEVEDLKREASVAEVLLIDTSESMGACHCKPIEGFDANTNDPFAGFAESFEGGVNKTDISRSAAARAINALSANDEIGILAFNGSQDWIVPLQQLPTEQVINEGLGSLRPFGETRIAPALREAAGSLRESSKDLRHIILFTDGFTPELFDPELGAEFGGGSTNLQTLIDEAAALAAEGITVSVVATGEGAIPALEAIATAGNGRFYPGRDLDEIPEIFVKEARLAARTFVNEGEYFPVVTSPSAAVSGLASSPPLAGFLATTPKPSTEVQLEIGEFSDPLLASWRIGLGKVTAWTSDGGERWAAQWAGWEGYADFWSAVVRDAFPLRASAGQRLTADITDDRLDISLESAEPWPAGTEPIARLSTPDGTSADVRLTRRSDTEFGAVVTAGDTGTYAIGVGFVDSSGDNVTASALATRSFSAEYLPLPADGELMRFVSSATGGRGEITPSNAFDGDDLEPGVSARTFRWWYLLAAALLWPLDVALRLLALRREDQDHSAPAAPHRSTPTSPAAV